MTDWEALLGIDPVKLGLERDAAKATSLLLEENGSAKADAYLADVDYVARLTAWKAAQ